MGNRGGGLAGVQTTRTATPGRVLLAGTGVELPHNIIISGSTSRDPENTGDVQYLQAGLLLGKITSGGKYAPSIIGTLNGDYDASSQTTSLTVTAGTAVEIVRRIGATGTFKMTGPPTAGGTVQTATVTYSAVNQTTGVITITSLAVLVAEVQTFTITGFAAGKCRIRLTDPVTGTEEITGELAHDANAATIKTALEATSIVTSNDIAVTGTNIDTAIFTFNGNNWQGVSVPLLQIMFDTAATSDIEGKVVKTTTGLSASANDYVDASFIQPTDGSETPLGLISDGYPVKVTDESEANQDQEVALLVGGLLDSSQIVNWPPDAALRNWLMSKLNGGTAAAPAFGPFLFDHRY